MALSINHARCYCTQSISSFFLLSLFVQAYYLKNKSSVNFTVFWWVHYSTLHSKFSIKTSHNSCLQIFMCISTLSHSIACVHYNMYNYCCGNLHKGSTTLSVLAINDFQQARKQGVGYTTAEQPLDTFPCLAVLYTISNKS